MEVVDEAVLNSKTHTMDSWLICRLSFPKESISAFFLAFCRVSESAAMSIWNFPSSLEMMAVRLSG